MQRLLHHLCVARVGDVNIPGAIDCDAGRFAPPAADGGGGVADDAVSFGVGFLDYGLVVAVGDVDVVGPIDGHAVGRVPAGADGALVRGQQADHLRGALALR